jgi:hypothetical protein
VVFTGRVDSPRPSRIEAGRRRADAAKQALAIGAVAVFGFLLFFFRGGGFEATAGPDVQNTPSTSGDFGSDDSFGGGAITPPSQGQSFPQAQTGMS